MENWEFKKFQVKNRTDDLLLSITKQTDVLIKQTQTKSQKTLEFKMNKPTEKIFLILHKI